jgi:hypothetical protein
MDKGERKHDHQALRVVVRNEDEVNAILTRLVDALDPYHWKDPELHQLWLETEWLLNNQRTGVICIPTKWELIVFQLIHRDCLQRHPEAHHAASELVHVLRTLICCDGEMA